MKDFFEFREAYRKPTAAEIAADKRKERKASGDKGPDSSARYKNIKKKVYGNAMGGLKKEKSEAAESTDNYRKSIDRIQAKKTRDSLTPSERDKLAKLHALMKKQRKTGNYKTESTDLEEKYAVKYTHPTDKKSGRTVGPMSKAAADKKAAMGNRVDKVGGKYTVIRHVEEDWKASSARRMRNKQIANEPYRRPEKDTRTDAERMSDRARLAKRFAAAKAKQDKAVTSKKEEFEESTMSDRQVVRAMRIAKDMAGNHTGATRAIEKLKKGLSNHPKVRAALRTHNESVTSADKKPQNYRDPETGKMKVRMVAVDKDISSKKTNESVELEERTNSVNYSRKDFENTKKGDKLEIKWGDSISSGRSATFVVAGKSASKKYNVEKLRLEPEGKKGGVKFFLRSRNGGDATFSIGDMAAIMTSIKKV